eukprot:2874709-Pyramimonas_sp.AAC.1
MWRRVIREKKEAGVREGGLGGGHFQGGGRMLCVRGRQTTTCVGAANSAARYVRCRKVSPRE